MSESNRKNNNQNTKAEENSEPDFDFNLNFGCGDINGGFQHIYPEVFIVVAEILGDVMAGRLPFNVQNAVGNWFELIGQVILTYNAQQQYFQGGPGRYFNPKYFNVSRRAIQSILRGEHWKDLGIDFTKLKCNRKKRNSVLRIIPS